MLHKGAIFTFIILESLNKTFFIRTLCVHKSMSERRAAKGRFRVKQSATRGKFSTRGYLYLLDPGGKLSWLSGYAELSGKCS